MQQQQQGLGSGGSAGGSLLRLGNYNTTSWSHHDKRSRLGSKALVPMLLMVVAAVVPVTTAAAVLQSQQEQQQKIISLALIPHHEQVRRRQLEMATFQSTTTAVADGTGRSLAEDGSRLSLGIHRVSRRRRTQSQVLDALYQGYGTHYVDLWCGTPNAQRQTVIVDTGSGVTAFPCLGCENCGDDGHHTDSLYNQTASASFHGVTCGECSRGSCSKSQDGSIDECRISMSYQEGSSWSAFEAVDVCYAGGPHDSALDVSTNEAESKTRPPSNKDDADLSAATNFAFPMMLGCQTHLTGLFRTQLADGIMGMDNADTSYWSQMHRAGKISKKLFSLCFSRQNIVNRKGTEAGAMTLGGSDPRLHTSPMVYTAAPEGFSGFYPVHMRRVYLRQGGGGNSAVAGSNFKVVPVDVSEDQLNAAGMIIVDSGTTDTYFSYGLKDAFSKAWLAMTGKAYSQNPVRMSAHEVDQLPTILFQLQGDEASNEQVVKTAADGVVPGLAGALDPDHPLDVILAMPPSHYMEYDERDQVYVARFYMDGSGNVLGANSIMGHDVMFDIDGTRIGWAESHCDYSQLLTTAKLPNPEPQSNSVKQVDEEVDGVSDGGDEDGVEGGEYGGTGGADKGEYEDGLDGDKDDDSDVNIDVEKGGDEKSKTTTTKKAFSFSALSSLSMKLKGAIFGGGLLVVVLIVAMVVRRVIVNRSRAPAPRREYQLTSELELGNVVAEEDDDFVQYRDQQPKHQKVLTDDDEMPSPPEIS